MADSRNHSNGFGTPVEGHSAQTELVKKLLQHPLQIIGVKLRIAVLTAPEWWLAPARQRDRHPAFLT